MQQNKQSKGAKNKLAREDGEGGKRRQRKKEGKARGQRGFINCEIFAKNCR